VVDNTILIVYILNLLKNHIFCSRFRILNYWNSGQRPKGLVQEW